MNGESTSQINNIIREGTIKLREYDPSFSTQNLRLVLNRELTIKAKLELDRDGRTIKLIINPDKYSNLDNLTKRKVLIYHELIHLWIGKDLPPAPLIERSYRKRLWDFTRTFNEDTKEEIRQSTRKIPEEGFEEILVNECTAKILMMDNQAYYNATDREWSIDSFRGRNMEVDRVIELVSHLFPNIKKVIDSLVNIDLSRINREIRGRINP